jgi:hypothetical protein
MAVEQAEAGRHDKAVLIRKKVADGGLLGRLQAAVDAAGAPAPAAAPAAAKRKPSLVEQRSFMITRWKRIPVDLRSEVDALRQAVADDAGDDDPAGLADAVSEYLEELLERLQDRLDAVVSGGDPGLLKGIRQEVEADALMVHLARNPVIDGTRFRKAVVDAIDEIEARMGA